MWRWWVRKEASILPLAMKHMSCEVECMFWTPATGIADQNITGQQNAGTTDFCHTHPIFSNYSSLLPSRTTDAFQYLQNGDEFSMQEVLSVPTQCTINHVSEACTWNLKHLFMSSSIAPSTVLKIPKFKVLFDQKIGRSTKVIWRDQVTPLSRRWTGDCVSYILVYISSSWK